MRAKATNEKPLALARPKAAFQAARPGLRRPNEIEVARSGRAICRETCAFKGGPPCFEVCRDLGESWPPASCNDPGCLILAEVALTAFFNPKVFR
jgi:hypothetical protein